MWVLLEILKESENGKGSCVETVAWWQCFVL